MGLCLGSGVQQANAQFLLDPERWRAMERVEPGAQVVCDTVVDGKDGDSSDW